MFCKKAVLLKISQYSRENACVEVSFYKCFPMNIGKFLRTVRAVASVQSVIGTNVFLQLFHENHTSSIKFQVIKLQSQRRIYNLEQNI